jgi:uncharacterized protein YecA (UPF0149 family)
MALQQLETALSDYIQAVRLKPDNVDFNFNVGAVYSNLGRLQEAMPYFEKAAKRGDTEAAKSVGYIRQKLKISSEYAQRANKNPQKQEMNKKKIGRNDPCPCGSGKKYKKCCLNN